MEQVKVERVSNSKIRLQAKGKRPIKILYTEQEGDRTRIGEWGIDGFFKILCTIPTFYQNSPSSPCPQTHTHRHKHIYTHTSS